jgi:hypothetical protein
MNVRKSKLTLCALALAAIFLFSGCGGGTKAPVLAPATAITSGTAAPSSGGSPNSTVPGYYTAQQSVNGGTDLKYINLRDIEVTKQSSDTIVTLTFKDGSLQMGQQEVDTKGVPKYSTQWIGGLNRFVLNINGLSNWDYEVWEDELKDTPILGIFKQIPVNNADTMLTKLYINMDSNVAYKIEEQGNKILLYLRAMPEEDRSDYYVLLNAFEEYTDGKVPDDAGLTPTLCKDKKNVTLISAPFTAKADADAFLNKINTDLVPKLPGTVASEQQLDNNTLPTYDENGALDAVEKMTVTRTDNTENSADVLVSNGKFLCWNPGNRAYVFVTPFFLGGDNGDEAKSYEMLYMNSLDSSNPTLLSQFEYSDISKAAFSEDGRYLAFLDQGDKNRTLYIYDTKKPADAPAIAAEHGFGMDTSNFVWGSGDNVHTIYAITGENDMLQLMSFTLADQKEPVAVTLVENAFTDGDMGYLDGKIYYSQSNEEDSTQNGIFAFDVATRSITRVCDGCNFEMNNKTGTMAVFKLISGDDSTYDLSYFNPRTNTSVPIVKAAAVDQCVWSNDGTMLYYSVYKDNIPDSDRFKLTLNEFDTSSNLSTALTDIVEGNLNPSGDAAGLLLTCLYPQKNQFVAITYKVALAH